MPGGGIIRLDEGWRLDEGHRFDEPPHATPQPLLVPQQPITLNSEANMEYWEVTKQRAQLTLPVWTQYTPTLKIGSTGTTELEGYIAAFEPLVQERTTAQDTADASYRVVQDALLKMKLLGTKVPAIIEAMLDENEALMADMDDLYRSVPRTEGTILARARGLYPLWVRANALLAAMTPPQPAITRSVAGTPFTAAMLKGLLDGYTDLVKDMCDTQEALDTKRAALRALDRTVDQANKRWYKAAKATFDVGSDAYEALGGIPAEGGTPAPDTIEIASVTQGGEEGLQVLVAYVPGGGDHATTKLVKWQVVGVDEGFAHSAPLDASGNALGPFEVGQVVKIITEVSNSAGTRSTAPRTITLQPPIV
ncbi:MAG: hypothetical protein HZC54_13345 [Verrucomicrobia bacterium]|nr:hypothetical protein [Verrucomicrobiota bacterium]